MDSESVVEYLDHLMNTLQRSLEIAVENLKGAQNKQKIWYDQNVRGRTFHLGKEVLMLRHRKGNKLQLVWEGPYTVV